VDAAAAGQGVGLLLRGPAGIGKSTLLRWLDAALFAEAALHLAAHRELTEERHEATALLVIAAAELGEDHPLAADVAGARARLALATPHRDDRDPADAPTLAGWAATPARARPLASHALRLAGDGDQRARAALVWRQAHTDPAAHQERRDAAQQACRSARTDRLRAEAHLPAAADTLAATLHNPVAHPAHDLYGLLQTALLALVRDPADRSLTALVSRRSDLTLPLLRATAALTLALRGEHADAAPLAAALAAAAGRLGAATLQARAAGATTPGARGASPSGNAAP